MSKIRLLLAGLGLAALAVPAVAIANASSSVPGCCGDEKPCCTKDASCCDKPEAMITCPLTGEQIRETECPLCKGRR